MNCHKFHHLIMEHGEDYVLLHLIVNLLMMIQLKKINLKKIISYQKLSQHGIAHLCGYY